MNAEQLKNSIAYHLHQIARLERELREIANKAQKKHPHV